MRSGLSGHLTRTFIRSPLTPLPLIASILVDDAVVVENIDRHWSMGDGRSRIQAAIEAVVDTDTVFHKPADRARFSLDLGQPEYFGVEEQAVYDTLGAPLGGVEVGYSHRGAGRDPAAISVRLPKSDPALTERLSTTPVPGLRGSPELGDLTRITREPASPTVYRRDGRHAEMVAAELAGRFEAPIHGMLAVQDEVAKIDWKCAGLPGAPEVSFHGQPEDEGKTTLLWDGEWEITYVTFRDMGAAFTVAILGIYLLVVGRFGSFKLPILVLVPVPLTLSGIILGHHLFNAPFSAPSMIGFIALAGIIVRNSIPLIDFARHPRGAGYPTREAVLRVGAVRFKPIVLTALAAIIGAAFILADPIFQGLAISLLFGLAGSTLLTVLVIPAIFVVLRD